MSARKSGWLRKSLWFFIPLALFVLWWVVPTLNKARLDAQVRELCAKDGGIKVYEMVSLPREMFDKYGVVSIPACSELAASDAYCYGRDMSYYAEGNPSLWRLHFAVIRRRDGKLLGESISYARRGGDPFGPWHDSSFGCPDHADISDLKIKIFSMK